jgi:hypothetical protein
MVLALKTSDKTGSPAQAPPGARQEASSNTPAITEKRRFMAGQYGPRGPVKVKAG